MRVVLTHHVADHEGVLEYGRVGPWPFSFMEKQHAAVNGLQAVAGVGEGAPTMTDIA